MSTPSGQGGPRRRRDLPDLRPEVTHLRRLTSRSRTAAALETEVSGILRRLEIEGHALVLDGEDGTRYELHLPSGWRAPAPVGRRVTVRGVVLDDVATTTQVGPVLRVRSLSPVTPTREKADEPPREV